MTDHWHLVHHTSMGILGFGITDGKFKVDFDSGSTYEYDTDQIDLCCLWAEQPSIGQFFHRFIKPLPTTKLS